LCISPVQAGIRPFSTANSSFIFDLLRLSIRLWAVFLAIFRPAALVVEGCFLVVVLEEPPVVVVVVVAFFAPPLVVGVCAVSTSSSCGRGFIWMILRDLVGGGGRANVVSFFCCCVVEERLLDFTVSLGWRYGAGDICFFARPARVPELGD
jgi:hypothetical protein